MCSILLLVDFEDEWVGILVDEFGWVEGYFYGLDMVLVYDRECGEFGWVFVVECYVVEV